MQLFMKCLSVLWTTAFYWLGCLTLVLVLALQSDLSAWQKSGTPAKVQELDAEALSKANRLIDRCKQLESELRLAQAVNIASELHELLIRELGKAHFSTVDASWEVNRLQILEKMSGEDRKIYYALKQKMVNSRASPLDSFLRTAEKQKVFCEKRFGKNHPETATPIFKMALACHQNRRNKQCYELLSINLDLFRAIWSDRNYRTLECKRLLASSAFYLEKFEEAARLMEQCVETGHEISLPAGQLIEFETLLAQLEQRLGRFAAAETRLERMIRQTEINGEQNRYHNLNRILGNLYLHQSKLEQARPLLRKAAAHRPSHPRSQILYATCLMELGNLIDAEKILAPILESHANLPLDQLAGIDLAFEIQALIENQRQNHPAAHKLHQKTYEIRKRVYGEFHHATLNSLSNLAAYRRLFGQHDDVQQFLRKAIQRMEEVKINPRQLNPRRLELAESLLETDQHEEAKSIFDRCLGDTPTNHEKLIALSGLAKIKLAKNDLRGSAELLEKAKAVVESTGIYAMVDRIEVNNALGLIGILEKKPIMAFQHYVTALNLRIEVENRLTINSPERIQLKRVLDDAESLNGLMTALINCKFDSSQLESGYEMVLNRKCSVANRQRFVKCKVAEYAHAEDLRKLEQLATRIQLEFSRLSSDASNENLVNLLEQKDRLEKRLLKDCPTFEQMFRQATPSDIEGVLRSDEAFMDFVAFHDLSENNSPKLAAFVIQKDSPVRLVVFNDAMEISQQISTWWAGQCESLNARKAAIRLKEKLVAPLLIELKSEVQELIVCPTGSLNFVPLGALPGIQQDKFLIEEFPISYQLSAKELYESRKIKIASNRDSGLLVVSNPDFGKETDVQVEQAAYVQLPGSEEEGNQIGRLFASVLRQKDPTILSQQSATKSRFQSLLRENKYPYIHVATHAFVKNTELESGKNQQLIRWNLGQTTGLVFSGANVADPTEAFLTADEIVNLPLSDTTQVVLSACNTSIGRSIGDFNEANFSLCRSFHVAGAKSIVASSWGVPDDATNLLMQQYYSNIWQKKMSKSRAMQQAKIWMINNFRPNGLITLRNSPGDVLKRKTKQSGGTTKASPYYWGAWTLSGDSR